MITFRFTQPRDVSQAIMAAQSSAARSNAPIRYLAGGTTLIDLMKLNVETPHELVDINKLPLNFVEELPGGGLKIGALVRNAALAGHPIVMAKYSVLSQALRSGASAQLRNMATTGGNLLQRTRCVYFRDVAMACNKREPGTGCSAIEGHNRMLAILGTSEHCIATNPSDMNVALTALEADIHLQGAKGERTIRIADFFLTPGDTPERENVLGPGELITHVTLPALPPNSKSAYVKLRDRASYEFALASAAVVAHVEEGRFQHVRVALGGVGTKPWRSLEAEHVLAGKPAGLTYFRAAADAALKGAHPRSENGFKIELAKRCLVHTLSAVTSSGSQLG